MGGVSEEAGCYPLDAYTHGYMRTSINERSLANQVSSYQYVSLSKAVFMGGIHLLIQIILAKQPVSKHDLFRQSKGQLRHAPNPNKCHPSQLWLQSCWQRRVVQT